MRQILTLVGAVVMLFGCQTSDDNMKSGDKASTVQECRVASDFHITGQQQCQTVLGYYYTGNFSCSPIIGCACEGPDCDRLFPDQASCEASCSCVTNDDCVDGYWCIGHNAGCIAPGASGQCAPLPNWTTCPVVDAPQVCGCDGQTYDDFCKAEEAGVNIADFRGPCP